MARLQQLDDTEKQLRLKLAELEHLENDIK